MNLSLRTNSICSGESKVWRGIRSTAAGTRGDTRVGHNRAILSLNTAELFRYAPPLVEGASLRGCVIGDSLGRSFWKIQLPDGTEEHSYFQLPAALGTVGLTMEGDSGGRDFPELAEHYVSKLETIVNDAVARFGS